MVKNLYMDISCAILAGGKSKRMGRDKATLPVGSKLLINRVYDEVRKVFKKIIIISNHHKDFPGIDSPIFKDILPVQSPVTGIVSALLYADTTYVFVLPCDVPFLSQQSMEYMISSIHGEDLIIPRTRGGYEPLYAIYNRSCISHLFRMIAQNNLKASGVLPYIPVRELEGEGPYFINNGYSVFTNINQIDDLEILKNEEDAVNLISF